MPSISPSLYTLIVYTTESPVFTVRGFLGCIFSAVVITPSLKSSKASLLIFGTLLVVGSTLFIDVMNFLNAKSKFSSTYVNFILSLYSCFSLSIITTGWSASGAPSTDQKLILVLK